MAETHSVMPKKLAQALMEASVKHFDVGGSVQNTGIFGSITPQNSYSANAPQITTQNLLPQVAQGQQEGQQIYGQQQTLAQTLLNNANGYGPSVAQNQLNEATGKNVANTAALEAGARGSSGNVGLMTRNIANAGANTEQAAAGQAAVLKAQEQQAATNAESGVLNNLATNNLQGQSINQGAIAAQNSAQTTGQLGAQQINSGVSQQNSNNTAGTMGGILGAVGGVASLLNEGAVGGVASLLNEGGEVKPQKFDVGGIAHFDAPTNPNMTVNTTPAINEFSAIDQMLGKDKDKKTTATKTPTAVVPPVAANPDVSAVNRTNPGGFAPGAGISSNVQDPIFEGTVGVPVSTTVPVSVAYNGGKIDYRSGGPVPGKAPIPGKNDPKNDIVPAVLSPGEEVLPLSVTKAKDPEKKAVEFMKHLKDSKDEESKPKGYGKVVSAKKSLKDRVAELEKIVGKGA